jgi:hypothetical protein
MLSDKGPLKVRGARACHLEKRFNRARELSGSRLLQKASSKTALRTLDWMSAEEMRSEKPSQSRMGKCSLLHHYLHYLNRVSEDKV